MKMQKWIFSVRHSGRHAVVGPAGPSTVEAALHLAKLPEDVRSEIRACPIVQEFIDAKLDPAQNYYYQAPDETILPWAVCIGSVHEVLADHCPVCEGPHQDALHRRRRAEGR